MNDFVAIDIETTGLNPREDKIIEIGAVLLREGKVVDSFSSFVNPRVSIPSKITKLTGITDEMIAKEKTIEVVIREFYDFVGDSILLGHNILFDYSFLKTALLQEGFEFERMGIDTLEISRILHKDLESRSLERMCNFYGINQKAKHRAYEDAFSAGALYLELKKHANATAEILAPKQLFYKVKKREPITQRQKNYLLDLLKYHKIGIEQPIDHLSKSEASRIIDKIILQYGRR